MEKVEKFFKIDNLADAENLEIQHNIILALRAHNLMHRDQDYVVADDEILIVDELPDVLCRDVVILTDFIRQLRQKSM